MWVNIGSGNAFLPDDTKPLPDSMLDLSSKVLGDIQLRAISQETLMFTHMFRNYTFKIITISPRARRVNKDKYNKTVHIFYRLYHTSLADSYIDTNMDRSGQDCSNSNVNAV